jgi:phosphonate transport system substrate-binding protein
MPFSMALLALLGAAPAAPAATPPLRITAIPDANKDTLREDQDKILAWLEARTGVKAVFLPVENYAAAVTALSTGQAELGWLGGVTTVQAMKVSQGKVFPLITRDEDRHFKSYVIVRTSLGAKSLKDLSKRSFAFGSKSSTSGHIMPRYYLGKEGIDPETFFSRVAYTGDHTKTVLDVASGAVDAGAVNYLVFDRLLQEKKVDPSEVQVLWTTPEFVDYAWCARRDLDERMGAGTTEKIKAAFMSLDPKAPGDRGILAIQQTKGYVAADPRWWSGIDAVLRTVDIAK